jgi:hypothetical protein
MVTPFLKTLASEIEFGASPEGEPVLAAMLLLPELRGSKKVKETAIDTELLVGSWRRLVLTGPHIETGTVDWRAYILCVLEQFWRHLVRKTIYAVHSPRWGDPRSKLLAGTTGASIWSLGRRARSR